MHQAITHTIGDFFLLHCTEFLWFGSKYFDFGKLFLETDSHYLFTHMYQDCFTGLGQSHDCWLLEHVGKIDG